MLFDGQDHHHQSYLYMVCLATDKNSDLKRYDEYI